MKILSLLPSATEIVYALGLGDQLEGVTFECDYPPDAQAKPVVSASGLSEDIVLGDIDGAVRDATADGTPLYRLDEDLIARVQPDLILTQDLCRVCAVPSGDVDEALGRLGCSAEVVSLDPHSLDDILTDIARVGEAVGGATVARAKMVVDSLRFRISAVEAAVSMRSVGQFGSAGQPPKVLVLEWVDPPWGSGHWIPDLVSIAGGEPVLAAAGGHADATTWEAIAAAAPDVVIVAPCGFHLEASIEQARSILPHLAATPAGQNDQIWAVDADAYIVRPGPRVVGGLELVAWILGGAEGAPPHPDATARIA